MLPARPALAAMAVLCLILAGCASPTTPPGTAGSKLLFGTEAAFPPFEDINGTSGAFVGFDIDLARAIGTHMGRDTQFQNLKFDALIPSVQNRQVDAAVSAMSIDDERKAQVDFSLPYYEANQSVAVRNDDAAIHKSDDLAGKSVGVQTGTTAEKWLVKHMVATGKMSNGSILRYESFPLSVEALKRGDVQAVMMDAPAVKDAVRNSGGIKLVFEISTGEQYGIAVRKGDSATLLGINDALRAMQADGSLQRLKDQWGV